MSTFRNVSAVKDKNSALVSDNLDYEEGPVLDLEDDRVRKVIRNRAEDLE